MTSTVSPEVIEQVWAEFVNCEDDRYFGNRTKREKQIAILQRFAAALSPDNAEQK